MGGGGDIRGHYGGINRVCVEVSMREEESFLRESTRRIR
jgi:hypothetical protein